MACIDKIDVCGCKIEDVKVVEDVKIFKLKTDFCVDFKAGQFFLLSDPKFKNEKKEVWRAYSVCSSEDEKNHLEFAITMLKDGLFSKHVENFKDGDSICIKGPYGKFFLDKTKDAIFFAGGCGVTPFISMLRTIRDENIPINATLVYSVKTLKDVLFYDELKEMNKSKNMKIVLCVTRQPDAKDSNFTIYTRRIDDEIIKKHHKSESLSYLCGPSMMISSLKESMIRLGINPDTIMDESW